MVRTIEVQYLGNCGVAVLRMYADSSLRACCSIQPCNDIASVASWKRGEELLMNDRQSPCHLTREEISNRFRSTSHGDIGNTSVQAAYGFGFGPKHHNLSMSITSRCAHERSKRGMIWRDGELPINARRGRKQKQDALADTLGGSSYKTRDLHRVLFLQYVRVLFSAHTVHHDHNLKTCIDMPMITTA